jgi:hypothetical protein
MFKFYEAQPGYWIPVGVSWEDHQRAMADNYEGPIEDLVEYYEEDFISPDLLDEENPNA